MAVFETPLVTNIHTPVLRVTIIIFCMFSRICNNFNSANDIVNFWGCAAGPLQARARMMSPQTSGKPPYFNYNSVDSLSFAVCPEVPMTPTAHRQLYYLYDILIYSLNFAVRWDVPMTPMEYQQL